MTRSEIGVDMQLKLIRNVFTDNSTIGELSVDGVFECFTLEDVVRPVKIKGETAIPAGTYEIEINMSPHFKKLLPELLDVPNFEGVRIHSGNKPEDTEGCILVGQTKGKDFVFSSVAAFGPLFQKIQDALDGDKVFIEIIEAR